VCYFNEPRSSKGSFYDSALYILLSSVDPGFAHWKTDVEILILKLKQFNFHVTANHQQLVTCTGLLVGKGAEQMQTLCWSLSRCSGHNSRCHFQNTRQINAISPRAAYRRPVSKINMLTGRRVAW
jgi:hypothetical protein